MFKNKKLDNSSPPRLVARWQAIAAQLAPLIYLDETGRAKRAPRHAVYRQAIATLQGGETLPVVIRNLNAHGCRIEFFRQTPLTPRLTIDEHSLSLHHIAEIVWQGDGAAGLKFIDTANTKQEPAP